MTWTDNHTLVMLWAARGDKAWETAERKDEWAAIGKPDVSFDMVRAYRHEALRMLGMHSIASAAFEAVRRGYLSLTDPSHPGYIYATK